MNEFLANIYGTSSLEKTAQNLLLSKLAEEENIDLSGLSDDQLEEMAQYVLTQDQQGDVDGGEISKEAEDNFAQADFLGRVMAHSFNQELGMIKSAGWEGVGTTETGMQHVGRSGRGIKDGPVKSKSDPRSGGGSFGQKAMRGIRGAANRIGSSRVGQFAGKHKGKAAIGAGVAAAAGAGYGLGKEASAFETLATQRAMEMLQEQGIDPSVLQQQEAQQAQQFQPQMQPQQRPQMQQRPMMPQQRPQFQQQQFAPQMQQQGYAQQQQAQGGYGQAQQGVEQQGGYEKLADPMEAFYGQLDDRAFQILSDAGYVGEE